MKSRALLQMGATIFVIFCMLTTHNCSKESLVIGDPSTDLDSILTQIVNDTLCMDFYLGLRQLPYLEQPESIPSPTNIGDPIIEESGNYVCEVQTVKWAPEYNEMFLLNPKTETIYPINLIDANSVSTGAYTPISNVERAPATISISLLTNPGEKPYIVISDPSLSTVRDATNILLHRVAPGSTPAFINFDIQEIRAREEAKLGIQTNFSGWGAKISSSYNFETDEKMSRFLVRFYQIYYTIDMDLPNTPCAMFKDGQLPGLDIFNGTSPVYISSVTYGRMVYFMVESSESSQSMKAALNASFHSFKTSFGLNISYEHSQKLEQSHISALVVGGNSDDAVLPVTGVDGLLQFLTAEGNFSATSPGAPIAYTMRYLKDNSVARIVLNSEYNIRNCEVKGEEHTFTPNNNNGNGYYYCAQLDCVNCDEDFGGHGPQVEGKIELLPKNGNEIWAKINFTWEETRSNWTKGVVKEEFQIGRAHV